MYKKGIYITESPTPLVAPVAVDSALPVVIGVGPVHRLEDPLSAVNEPFLVFNFGEAQQRIGYTDSSWQSPDGKPIFNLSEFIFSQFRLHRVGPAVLINVWNPLTNATDVAISSLPIINGIATIDDAMAMISTVKVLKSEDGEYVRGVDYELRYDGDELIITVIEGGTIPSNTASLTVNYKQADPAAVTNTQIIGGVDADTQKRLGLEAAKEVFLRFGRVPGFLLSPGWTSDPEVGLMFAAAAEKLGDFSCIALLDLPTLGEYSDFTKIPEWKRNNSYVSPYAFGDWPCFAMGERVFHASTRLAGMYGQVDAGNGGLPFEQASNKTLQMTNLCQSNGTLIPMLDVEQANSLTSNGIGTAINYDGWRLWGVETLAFPGNTDVKDYERGVRRMFNFVQNVVNRTMRQKLDLPVKRRLIDSVLLTGNEIINMWIARGALLGGEVLFLREDNPNVALISGELFFRASITPPLAAKAMTFDFSFDPTHFDTLFG